MRRRGLTALLACVAIAAVGAGCGAEDFANEPRPPAPIQLSAQVNERKVILSPTDTDGIPIGAGLANVTIDNRTTEPVQLTFSGPVERTAGPVIAKGTLNYNLELEEGDYVVSTADAAISEAAFAVGPERPSAQNDLLLP